MDERAKMSVAAKRSLFRVHFPLYMHFSATNRWLLPYNFWLSNVLNSSSPKLELCSGWFSSTHFCFPPQRSLLRLPLNEPNDAFLKCSSRSWRGHQRVEFPSHALGMLLWKDVWGGCRIAPTHNQSPTRRWSMLQGRTCNLHCRICGLSPHFLIHNSMCLSCPFCLLAVSSDACLYILILLFPLH